MEFLPNNMFCEVSDLYLLPPKLNQSIKESKRKFVQNLKKIPEVYHLKKEVSMTYDLLKMRETKKQIEKKVLFKE